MELKKVNYSEKLSEETPAFTAELWDNGKLMAYVSNRGDGGGNIVKPADGLTFNDVVKYDNLDVEAEIFGMVYDYADTQKFQYKAFVLKKDDKMYTQNFPMPINTLKN